MTWELLVPLIVKYGIPGAMSIWQVIRSGPPSDESWDALLKLSQKTLDEYKSEAKP
jgi:hypothetical protein